MTIAVALKIPDGIVLGADSTTTVRDGSGAIAQLFNSAQKVFEIGPANRGFTPGCAFSGGVVTFNAGSFGPISWRNLINAFYQHRVSPEPCIPDLPTSFLAFAKDRWAELEREKKVPPGTPLPNGGFMFGSIGIGQEEVVGGKIELSTGTVEPLEVGGVQIGGGFEVVSRLLYGYDVGLENELPKVGVDVGVFKKCAEQFRAIPPVNALPLRDAIDFVHFLIYSAIKLHRYRGAAAMIGGAIEIAAITADRGFRWIEHKPLQESIGIPRGGQVS